MNETVAQPDEIDLAPDAEQDQIESILKAVTGPGWQVVITRTTPSWCQGYLDTWSLDEGIDLNEIRDTYGGSRFQLKVQRPTGSFYRTVSIRIAGGPKVDGVDVPRGGLYEKGGQVLVTPPPAPPAPPAQPDQLGPILAALQKQQEQNQALMLKMIEQKQEKSDPFTQMAAMMQMFSDMRKMSDDMGGGAEPTELGQMATMFGQMFADKKQAAAAVEPRLIAAPPGGAKAVPTPNPSPAPPPAVVVDDTEEEYNDDDQTIADELTELGPLETANVLGEVMSRWSPEQQQAAINAMMNGSAVPPEEEETQVDINSPTAEDSRSSESSSS